MPNIDEPLDAPIAHKLIRQIVKTGTINWHSHAIKAMADDNLSAADVLNILRAGLVEPAEWNGEFAEWRYRVRTQLMYAVIAFQSEVALLIVTAWRLNRKKGK